MNQNLKKLYSLFTISDLENPVTAQSIAVSASNLDKDYYGIQDEDIEKICTSCLTIEEHESCSIPKPKFCKDCNLTLKGSGQIFFMDNGDALCHYCANEAEAAANADWQMKESAQRS